MITLTETFISRAIEQAHAGTLALPVDGVPPLTLNPGSGGEGSLVYRAAKQACLRMGFIDADADCAALAWQQQSARLGGFDASLWPTEPQDFKLNAPALADALTPGFPSCPQRLGLYAVLPDADWVARMAQAGVPTLQLRFKSDDAHAVRGQVRAAVAAVRGTSSLLFVNDHWRAALDAGAYGVHLGQEDLHTADLGTIRNAGLRLGVSSHGYAEMLVADRVSPSYIAMGAVFPTTLKRMVTPPQGTGRLRVYAQLMRHYPQVAIGGIDAARLDAVLATGVGAVAVVRAITDAAHPEQVAREWMQKIPVR